MLTDTHAHLDYPDFAEDLPEVLERARDAGVTRVVTIGTSLEGSARCLELAEQYPMVWAVVGVHPGSLDEGATMDRARLRELAQHPRAVAIGEAGLDYYRPPEGAEEAALATWKARQHATFAVQLEVAAELGMNVVVHQRSSWDDTLEAMRPFTGRLRGVFHCFGGTPAEAAEGDRARAPRVVHGHRDLQERPRGARERRGGAGRPPHGGNGLPVPRARPLSRPPLRADACAPGRREGRRGAGDLAGGVRGADGEECGGVFPIRAEVRRDP